MGQANLYIYTSLFVLRGGKKSKSDIDLSIRGAVETNTPVPSAIIAAKALRKSLVDSFEFKPNFGTEALKFVFSIIDFYSANENWLREKYANETEFTLEHFIIPANNTRRVRWRAEQNYEFRLLGTHATKYKKLSYNKLILPRELNEALEHDDIIQKITEIRKWYVDRQREVPRHIALYIEHIEALPSYQELKNCKGAAVSHADIEAKYHDFIAEYFSEDKQSVLRSRIQQAFQDVFENTAG